MSIVGLLLLSKKIHGKLKPGEAIVERSRIPLSQGVTLIFKWVKMCLYLHDAGFTANVVGEVRSTISTVIPEAVTVTVVEEKTVVVIPVGVNGKVVEVEPVEEVPVYVTGVVSSSGGSGSIAHTPIARIRKNNMSIRNISETENNINVQTFPKTGLERITDIDYK